MDAHYLRVEKLVCGYRNFRLNSVSFSVRKGELSGIIGPNGSGKTTLLKAICREISILSGTISLNQMDLSRISFREQARSIAVVTQHTEPVAIRVEDYVLLGRMPYRRHFQFFETQADMMVAEKYMKLTGVWRYRDKLMNQLSGGERQLAAIARALTQEPQLLLMDEPTSQLDISHQIQVLNLVQELNTRTGLTVLMILHDLNLASEFCDFLLLMHEGSLCKQGTPAEVLDYRTIEEVYNTIVFTQENPLSKKPAVFLVSNKVITQNQELMKQ